MESQNLFARLSCFFFSGCCLLLLASCSLQKKISRSAKGVIRDPVLQTANLGISIYEPATGKYWYDYQGDHYFVPASNTKIPTCYAAMKYLGDSLAGAGIADDGKGGCLVFPTGDPTFLQAAFPSQPVFDILKMKKQVLLYTDTWKDDRWGNGWSWNDYDAAYMAERSPFPMYGNVADFFLIKDTLKFSPPGILIRANKDLGFDPVNHTLQTNNFSVERGIDSDEFVLKPSQKKFSGTSIPLRADMGLMAGLLADTLGKAVIPASIAEGYFFDPVKTIIYSRPTDSLLKPMMHHSDNFFAEQTLMMLSNERLGYMKDEAIIDTLLKTDFAFLPQTPRWVDGSGLSRYNLFSPQDFVAILTRMQQEFGMERIRVILPTGGEGTLGNYYVKEKGFVYGKTGTLSGVVAFSGFLYTRKGKLLVFSTLVNNHRASATAIRHTIEKFLVGIRKKY
ncbi:MAG: hypothetical protein GC171_13700 [Terrimonas sp.]|nr:hypothetical protein [Terrimonas sp.]